MVVRLGNGGWVCWLRRKNKWGSVVCYYILLFCRLMLVTSGFVNFMCNQNTMLPEFIIVWYRWIKLSTMIIHIIWHKEVHLIVNLSVWHLLRNHIPTIDNLIKRMMLMPNTHLCSGVAAFRRILVIFFFFVAKRMQEFFNKKEIIFSILRKLRSDPFRGWRQIIIILLLTIICDGLSLFCVRELLLLPPSHINRAICKKILSQKIDSFTFQYNNNIFLIITVIIIFSSLSIQYNLFCIYDKKECINT
jgi:hypothetical protein